MPFEEVFRFFLSHLGLLLLYLAQWLHALRAARPPMLTFVRLRGLALSIYTSQSYPRQEGRAIVVKVKDSIPRLKELLGLRMHVRAHF